MDTQPTSRRTFFQLAIWERPFIKWTGLVIFLAGLYDLIVNQFLPTDFGQNMPTIYELIASFLNSYSPKGLASIPWWSWFLALAVLLILAVLEFAFRYWRRGGSLESLVYLSSITCSEKAWEEDKTLKFFMRGYNASPRSLEFEFLGGNLFYSKPKGDQRKLKSPTLKFPARHPVPPFSEFGMTIIQTLSKEAISEISEQLKTAKPVRFEFDNLKIGASVEGVKKSTKLDFKKNNWATIDLTQRAGHFHVSKVVFAFIKIEG